METPKYFIFDRRLIGAFDVAKRMLENLAAGNAGATFATGEWSTFGVVTFVLIAVRVGLSALVSFSVSANPIQVQSETKVDTGTVLSTPGNAN